MPKFNPRKMTEQDILNWVDAGLFAMKELGLTPAQEESLKSFLWDVAGVLDSE